MDQPGVSLLQKGFQTPAVMLRIGGMVVFHDVLR